jgi:hypothetical protein
MNALEREREQAVIEAACDNLTRILVVLSPAAQRELCEMLAWCGSHVPELQALFGMVQRFTERPLRNPPGPTS